MDDLDDILDSALDDFQKFDISSSKSASSANGSVSKERAAQHGQSDPWGPSGSDGNVGATLGQGLGLGLPGLSTAGKKKASRGKALASSSSTSTTISGAAAANGGSGMAPPQRPLPPPQRPLSATLEKLQQQTRETVGNIDVVDQDNVMGDELVDTLMKQFEELGGAQDMQSIMDTMMRNLLSKDVLHEPMKEIGERYPQWLAANKSQLSQEDYNRFSTQHEYILQLCDVYESAPNDFQKIMDLMQSMQNCGQPPSDIVKELAPGLDLDQDGEPVFPDFSAIGPGNQPNCSIM